MFLIIKLYHRNLSMKIKTNRGCSFVNSLSKLYSNVLVAPNIVPFSFWSVTIWVHLEWQLICIFGPQEQKVHTWRKILIWEIISSNASMCSFHHRRGIQNSSKVLYHNLSGKGLISNLYNPPWYYIHDMSFLQSPM